MDAATALTYINTWTAAQTALASNSQYTLSFPNGTSRTVTRADEATIRNQITYWQRIYNALDAKDRGAPERGFVTPRWT